MSDIDDQTTAEALWQFSEDGAAARDAHTERLGVKPDTTAARVDLHRREMAALHAQTNADTVRIARTLTDELHSTQPDGALDDVTLEFNFDPLIIEGSVESGGEIVVAPQPYRPPYFDERAWNTNGRDEWVRWTAGGLRRSSRRAVEAALDQLADSHPRWREQPYLTAIVMPAGRAFLFAGDILAADTLQLREWHAKRAERPRYDVEVSADMLRLLALHADNELDAMHKGFDYAYAATAEAFARIEASLPKVGADRA